MILFHNIKYRFDTYFAFVLQVYKMFSALREKQMSSKATKRKRSNVA